jgi:D-inositol-3-phosphate glycosyltransferase
LNEPAFETLSPSPAADPHTSDLAALRKGGIEPRADVRIGLLTGGDDKSYALGLASALLAEGVSLDFIGSDTVDGPMLHGNPKVNFLNLRGSQREDVSFARKLVRILAYYWRLILYAASASAPIFHILWNNKFEWFDRTVLMLYYRLLGKKLVMTVHNVNAAKRDSRDSLANRITLRAQYRLAHNLFVHTERMKDDLRTDFGIPEKKVSVIPFGINATLPTTAMDTMEARNRLGLLPAEQVVLFFGQIAPYKGLELLVAAFSSLIPSQPALRLLIAGKVKKGCEDYWQSIQSEISRPELQNRVISRIQHIPDDDVEMYFKAADVLALPYVEIFQSGVPFLAYNFGLPVIATDVGSLREDVIEGTTGMICKPRSAPDLAAALKAYFRSELFHQLESSRACIREYAMRRYSWTKVAEITAAAYSQLLDARTMRSPAQRTGE